MVEGFILFWCLLGLFGFLVSKKNPQGSPQETEPVSAPTISRKNLFGISRTWGQPIPKLFPFRDVPDGITRAEAVNLGIWLLRLSGIENVEASSVEAARVMLETDIVKTGLWCLCIDDAGLVWLTAEGDGLPKDSAIELGTFLISLDFEGALETGLVPGHEPKPKTKTERRWTRWLRKLRALFN